MWFKIFGHTQLTILRRIYIWICARSKMKMKIVYTCEDIYPFVPTVAIWLCI